MFQIKTYKPLIMQQGIILNSIQIHKKNLHDFLINYQCNKKVPIILARKFDWIDSPIISPILVENLTLLIAAISAGIVYTFLISRQFVPRKFFLRAKNAPLQRRPKIIRLTSKARSLIVAWNLNPSPISREKGGDFPPSEKWNSAPKREGGKERRRRATASACG